MRRGFAAPKPDEELMLKEVYSQNVNNFIKLSQESRQKQEFGDEDFEEVINSVAST